MSIRALMAPSEPLALSASLPPVVHCAQDATCVGAPDSQLPVGLPTNKQTMQPFGAMQTTRNMLRNMLRPFNIWRSIC